MTPYGGDPIGTNTLIDISHEALIRCWTRLSDPKGGWLIREFEDGLIWKSLLVQADSFERDTSNILSPATARERSAWLEPRNPAWAERYGGGWTRVARLVRASVKEAEEAEKAERNQRERQIQELLNNQRKQRWIRGIITVAALLFAALAAAATWFWWTAKNAETSQRTTNDRLHVAEQDLQTRNGDLKRTQALLLMQNGWSDERIKSASADLVKQSLDAGQALQRLTLPTSGAEPPTRGLSLVYYPKEADGKTETEILLQYWILLGYRPSSETAINSMSTNTIWFRGNIRSDDLKRIALTLMRAGIQLRAIVRLTTEGSTGVFVGHQPDFSDFKPWSVQEVADSHELGSLNTARQFAIVLLKPESAVEGERYLLSKHIFTTTLSSIDPTFDGKTVTRQMPVDEAGRLSAELGAHGIRSEVQKP